MAPVADEDDAVLVNRLTYPGSIAPIPTIFTVTNPGPKGKNDQKVAYLINSWFDQDGPHTYTISTFTDMEQADAVAKQLEKEREEWSSAATLPVVTPMTPVPPASLPSAVATATVAVATSYSTPAPLRPPNASGGPSAPALTASIIVPIIVCVIVVVSAVFWVRDYRRKARKAQAVEMASRDGGASRPEMKSASTNPNAMTIRDERAYIAPTSSPAMAASEPAQRSPIASPAADNAPPVILSTTMNTYYTGIDTSDAVSVAEDRRSMASRDTYGEEPPPPYRPCSVPPISRTTSVRSAYPARAMDRHASVRTVAADRTINRLSGASMLGPHEMRSPFDDPDEEDDEEEPEYVRDDREYVHDDREYDHDVREYDHDDRLAGRDDISEVSTIRQRLGRRSLDEVSVVSAVSYQEDTQPTSAI